MCTHLCFLSHENECICNFHIGVLIFAFHVTDLQGGDLCFYIEALCYWYYINTYEACNYVVCQKKNFYSFKIFLSTLVFNFQGVILVVIKIAVALPVSYSKKATGTANTLNNLIKVFSVQ